MLKKAKHFFLSTQKNNYDTVFIQNCHPCSPPPRTKVLPSSLCSHLHPQFLGIYFCSILLTLLPYLHIGLSTVSSMIPRIFFFSVFAFLPPSTIIPTLLTQVSLYSSSMILFLALATLTSSVSAVYGNCIFG